MNKQTILWHTLDEKMPDSDRDVLLAVNTKVGIAIGWYWYYEGDNLWMSTCGQSSLTLNDKQIVCWCYMPYPTHLSG